MNSVIKSTSYTLVHAPDMIIHNGATQVVERVVDANSEYLKELPKHIRAFDDVCAYAPNQTYIGNMTPEELEGVAEPWYENGMKDASRYGKYGQIMPQDEFTLLIQACDVFDLVFLDADFVKQTKPTLAKNPVITEDVLARIKDGVSIDEIKAMLAEGGEGLYQDGKLIGVVKKGHDIDVNLTSHILHENLVSKATSVLSLLCLVQSEGVNAADIDYVIDCSEEACGDMNQRGGGNFAKAAAEIAGLVNATGSDTRGFCAGPTHALITAASLVKAGAYKCVAITAGGATAKLGMNGKDHVKKGMPVLEDVLGGFSVLVTANDGVSPEINLDIIGRHTVGTGSSPQAVISSLVAEPLEKNGMTIADIDKYSVEMQNPDVTKPAGAGDVPLANYKMIAALAVKRGEIQKADLASFTKEHGMVGWAPTQGHIPSGVPYIGFALEKLKSGDIKRVMIVGKGSLFLARMTNLFDGVSVVLQPNSGESAQDGGVSEAAVKSMIAKAMREFAQSFGAEEE